MKKNKSEIEEISKMVELINKILKDGFDAYNRISKNIKNASKHKLQKEKQETVENNLNEIKSLLEEGSYEDAHKKAGVFIAEKDYKNNKNSKNENICKLYAKTLKKCGDSEDNLDKKFGFYEKYIRFIDHKKPLFGNDFGNNKDKSFIYTKLAEIVDIKGDSASTILEYAEKALEINKDSTDARKYKSIALNQQGNEFFESENYKLAIDKYTEAIKNEPNIADSHFYQSKAQHAAGYYEAAIKSVKAAIRLDCNNDQYKALEVLIINKLTDALCSAGEEQYQNGQYKDSLDNYKKALEYIENNNDCKFGELRAKAYLSMRGERYEEAKDSFAQALEINPKDHRCNVEIAKLCIFFGEYEEANTYLSKENIPACNTPEVIDLKLEIDRGLEQSKQKNSQVNSIQEILNRYSPENVDDDQGVEEVSLGGITIVESAELT